MTQEKEATHGVVFFIVVAAFCLLMWLMVLCFCLYFSRRLDEMRRESRQFKTDRQEGVDGTLGMQHQTLITIPEHPWRASMGDPVQEFSTEVDDPSTSTSQIYSPFALIDLPNAYGNWQDDPLSGTTSLSSGKHTNRGLTPKAIPSDASGSDISPPIFPELRYDIQLMDLELGELGTGAFGCVKEAIYITHDGEVCHVAVKYARDSTWHPAKIFRSELEIISKLPLQKNIVQYYGGNLSKISSDADYEDDCFIVMELMFTNLQGVIQGNLFEEGMHFGLIVSISLDIINGLDHLHEYGIIHYDLKPSNVLLDECFSAKLADFGSSKKMLKSLTTASFRGTLGYIAPEILLSQFVDRMQVSEKLDIYSMGVVMWEMVTGESPPNPYSSYSSSFQDSCSRNVEIIPRVLYRNSFKHASQYRCPPPLKTLIEDCLSIEPTRRPTTREVKERLLDIQGLY